ncbi:hypothetical protein [uncultured Methanoregula sp.]|uniref:DNA-3-methyladenine glycosylase family protein n=1 Tax=uncultured Methanoregula sp. TaxID=1005933 RepID=UPI002AAAE3E1|nr:hypothetical protein [uncultured Methanoregula sp.]
MTAYPPIAMPSVSLFPKPPYDFSLSAAIFGSGDPYIRTFRNNVFRQVLASRNGPVLAEVRSTGTIDNPALSLALFSDKPVSRGQAGETAALITSMFSLQDDLSPFYAAVRDDPVLADLTVKLRGVRVPVTPTVFEAVTDSIIEQQISLKAARSIENRLIMITGHQLVLDGLTYYCYPEPEVLAHTPDDIFRACGLTLRKGEYIRGIARQILDGDLDLEGFRMRTDTEDIISDLVKIRGIGRWTAELAVIRGLHRPDAFPADDVAVRRFISRFYHNRGKVSSADARLFAERWGAYRGFAAYYLEVAELLKIEPGNAGNTRAGD